MNNRTVTAESSLSYELRLKMATYMDITEKFIDENIKAFGEYLICDENRKKLRTVYYTLGALIVDAAASKVVGPVLATAMTAGLCMFAISSSTVKQNNETTIDNDAKPVEPINESLTTKPSSWFSRQ